MKPVSIFLNLLGVLSVSATMMSPVLGKENTTQPAKRSGPATDMQASAALALEQPVALPLVLGELGWIKRCMNRNAPDECIVDGGFALDHGLPPTMEVSVLVGTQAGAHPITVLVPLDLRLQSGFALTLEGSTDAYVGTYSTCRAVGCYGQVILDDASYDRFLKAKSIGVLVSNMSGRTVQLGAPLEGMVQAFAGPSMTLGEVAKAQDAARAKLVAAGQAREDAARDRIAAAGKSKQDKPATPSPEAGVKEGMPQTVTAKP